MLQHRKVAAFFFNPRRCHCAIDTIAAYCTEGSRAKNKFFGGRSVRKEMVDKVQIKFQGGRGGDGLIKAGGVGGDGGGVIIKSKLGGHLDYLLEKPSIEGNPGETYNVKRIKMKNGKDVCINVPTGTEIKDRTGVVLYDLDTANDEFRVVAGGVGGSVQTPGGKGRPGEKKLIILEYKTIADACLTGFPNAGKSSLLCALSRAAPKVASYAFTTINPRVGQILYTDNSRVKVADLPGLIEDAHIDKGMGHKFLQHIERTKIVILVIDVNGFQLKDTTPYRSPLETMLLLFKELALYKEVLLHRRFLLVFNKMDVEGADEKYEQTLRELDSLDSSHWILQETECYAENILQHIRGFVDNVGTDVLPVSALQNTGIDGIKLNLHRMLHHSDGELELLL